MCQEGKMRHSSVDDVCQFTLFNKWANVDLPSDKEIKSLKKIGH